MSPLAKLLEAALFSASRPLLLEELATLEPERSRAEITAALEELRAAYGGDDHGVELAEIADHTFGIHDGVGTAKAVPYFQRS